MTAADGRTRHYGHFYQVPGSTDRKDLGAERPLVLVWGNCQAEALRVLLSSSHPVQFDTIRIPPVFELNASDLDPLRTLARRADILLTQPVRDDYRDLPLGSRQVREMMPAGARVVRWPVIRYSGFHPYQVIVRDPAGLLGDPPVVPYHDLRTITAAATGRQTSDLDAPADSYREVAGASLQELARREREQCDVGVSDLLESSNAVDMFTINHPGNRILLGLTERLQNALGTPVGVRAPGRDLLGEIRAPADRRALSALGLSPTADEEWSVRGAPVSAADISTAQLAWYRQHPQMIEAALVRHQNVLATLGLLG